MSIRPNFGCHCNNRFFKKIINIKKKPKYEINYSLKNYNRSLFQCRKCKHIFNSHKFDLKNLYGGMYVKQNYKSIDGIKENFKKIIHLPKSKSDNKKRITRILKFIKFAKLKNLDLLDIGSGLGVFPYALKNKGIKVTSIEKDKILIQHLKKFLFIRTFSNLKSLKSSFNFITINKVLEHLPNMKYFLNLTLKKLKKKGYLYLEVPDYIAQKESLVNREEFFIEHYNIFSEVSLSGIINNFNLTLLNMKRIKEPSGKYTLYAFCQK